MVAVLSVGCVTGPFGTEVGPRMVMKDGLPGCRVVVGRLARFPWKHLVWRDGRDLDISACGLSPTGQLKAMEAEKNAIAAREGDLQKKVKDLEQKVSDLTPKEPAVIPAVLELPK